MDSYEKVMRTLNGENPSSVARQLWYLPWVLDHYPREFAQIRKDYPDDIIYIGASNSEISALVKGDPYAVGEFQDDWGCVFSNIHKGIIGEVKDPLVQDEEWDDADRVHIPYEWLSFDVQEANRNCNLYGKHKFKIAAPCPRPFERLQFIRGTENFYVDLMLRPEKMFAFMKRMHAFYCELLEKWAKTEVDGLMFMDDWGSQNSLLINPATWRELFKSMYKDYIDIAHAHGKKAFMHSDGYILEIYPDLIELGLDALNSQIFCMGIDKLAAFKGKITFWGEMDRQHLLVNASPQEIKHSVKSVYDCLWSNGRCIAQCEFGAGAKPDNVRAYFEAWEELTK